MPVATSPECLVSEEDYSAWVAHTQPLPERMAVVGICFCNVVDVDRIPACRIPW